MRDSDQKLFINEVEIHFFIITTYLSLILNIIFQYYIFYSFGFTDSV